MSDDEKVKQESSGIGNVQANNNSQAWSFVNIFGEYPIEKILFAELIAASVIQCLLHLFGLYAIFDPMMICLYAPLCLCSPLIFGINSLYGLMMGVMKKDVKLIVVSIISGFLAIVPTLLYFVYRVLMGN